MAARFRDHLLEGTHAELPAVEAAPGGTLFACSDHRLIYQNDGVAWTTWAVLGADPSTVGETVRDTIGAALVAGAGVTITPDDAADTITITATFDAESARDAIAAALVAGPGVTITPDDVADTVTITATFDAETARDTLAAALVAGDRTDITVDDAANTITIQPKRQVVLLEVGQTAANVPAGTPVGALIFRKV